MATQQIKWATERRFQFVEHQAYWWGSLNRADLTSHFGISVPQASKDISAYLNIAPDNLRYDHREKRYFPTDDFQPEFIDLNVGELLEQTLQQDPVNTVIGVDTLSVPTRNIRPNLFRQVLQAIKNRKSIEIEYQSMNSNSPDAVWRMIFPHAFGSDGFRWHVRAYCHRDSKFKDFILSRILGVRPTPPHNAIDQTDRYWNNIFEVALMPNPALSPNQQRIIEMDYGMSDGRLIMPVRMAMLYYFYKRLRLDLSAVTSRPAETPIIIENQSEFDLALREATS